MTITLCAQHWLVAAGLPRFSLPRRAFDKSEFLSGGKRVASAWGRSPQQPKNGTAMRTVSTGMNRSRHLDRPSGVRMVGRLHEDVMANGLACGHVLPLRGALGHTAQP